MSQENKDMIKHALISIAVGAVITILQVLLTMATNFLHDNPFSIAGPLSGLIYYIKGRNC
jgi:archaellum biogenesis protein FlaJ (TadC family)